MALGPKRPSSQTKCSPSHLNPRISKSIARTCRFGAVSCSRILTARFLRGFTLICLSFEVVEDSNFTANLASKDLFSKLGAVALEQFLRRRFWSQYMKSNE